MGKDGVQCGFYTFRIRERWVGDWVGSEGKAASCIIVSTIQIIVRLAAS